MAMMQTRRRFLPPRSLAGTACLARVPQALAAEAPPETTVVRLSKIAGICIAPQYVAEELLRAEGFTDVRYVETTAGEASTEAPAKGNIDLSLHFAAPLATLIHTAAPNHRPAGVQTGR